MASPHPQLRPPAPSSEGSARTGADRVVRQRGAGTGIETAPDTLKIVSNFHACHGFFLRPSVRNRGVPGARELPNPGILSEGFLSIFGHARSRHVAIFMPRPRRETGPRDAPEASVRPKFRALAGRLSVRRDEEHAAELCPRTSGWRFSCAASVLRAHRIWAQDRSLFRAEN